MSSHVVQRVRQTERVGRPAKDMRMEALGQRPSGAWVMTAVPEWRAMSSFRHSTIHSELITQTTIIDIQYEISLNILTIRYCA